MLAYQATIVWAEQNYEGQQWVTYDCQFRREALAKKDLNWLVTNHHLYLWVVLEQWRDVRFAYKTTIQMHTVQRTPSASLGLVP